MALLEARYPLVGLVWRKIGKSPVWKVQWSQLSKAPFWFSLFGLWVSEVSKSRFPAKLELDCVQVGFRRLELAPCAGEGCDRA